MLAAFLLFECLCALVGLKHGEPLLGAMRERWEVQGRTGNAARVVSASVPESPPLGLCQQPCLAGEKEGWKSGTTSLGSPVGPLDAKPMQAAY